MTSQGSIVVEGDVGLRYADGSELISHIKAIDPDFLEAEDIKSLEEGITLSSKEDMFILIEDYSS